MTCFVFVAVKAAFQKGTLLMDSWTLLFDEMEKALELWNAGDIHPASHNVTTFAMVGWPEVAGPQLLDHDWQPIQQARQSLVCKKWQCTTFQGWSHTHWHLTLLSRLRFRCHIFFYIHFIHISYYCYSYSYIILSCLVVILSCYNSVIHHESHSQS